MKRSSWFAQLQGDLQRSLERFAAGKVSNFKKLLLQALISVLGFWFTFAVVRTAGFYPGSTTILVVILVALAGELWPALLFSLLLILADDYYFIPPVRSLFSSQASIDHFAVVGIVALVVNFLIYVLRAAFRLTLSAKSAMELAKQEAERSAQAMEKLLAHVSHDVRNPLASVKLMAQLIARQPAQAEKNQQLANRISEGLSRVDGMIQTLLDVSRLRAGQEIPLLFETCDLRKIVERTVEDLKVGVSCPLLFSGDDALVGIWSPEGIRRAVENLVSNALKYGDQTRPVTVRVSRNRATAIIAVHNEGRAISFAEQATLFDSYRRASTGSQTKGWGLGLALVKGVAEAHDGEVQVASSAEIGTTFTLTLPISGERRNAAKQAPAAGLNYP